MSVTVKSVYGDDIRRFVIPNDSSFEDFAKQLRQAYELGNARFSVRFLDDENELITVTTDAGLREALSLAVSGFVKILKFQVHLLPEVKPAESKATDKLPPVEKAAEKPPAVANKPPPEGTKTPPEGPKPSLQASAPPFRPPQPQEAPSKIEVLRLLRELFTDSEVAKILPSVLQVFQSSLMHPATSLQHVIDHILGAFPLIKNHPSMVALHPWLPTYVPKLEPFRQGLCQMASNFPCLLQMFENNNLNLGSFFGGHNPWEDNEDQDDEECQFERESVNSSNAFGGWTHPPSFCGPTDVHLGVSCDACGMKPIQGIRYKCSVCPNFDLCASCEAKDAHTVSHPLIKTRAPAQPSVPFMGPPGMPQPPMPSHFVPPFAPPFGGWPAFVNPFAGRGRRCPRRWGACQNPGLERSNSRCWRAAQPLQATFVRECNLQDRTEVSPSQTLVKTWELQNSGAMAWPAGTKLTYARGDLPSIENSFDVEGPVEPGQTVQVSAVVRTPCSPGRYRAFFKLEDNQNNRFGPRLWCDVTVVTPSQASEQAAGPTECPEEKEALKGQAFWEKEEAREAAERAEKLRKEAEECTVVHAKPEEPDVPSVTPTVVAQAEGHKYQTQLAELHSMGYTNEELNVYLLDQHQGNVESVCAWLLEQV